MKSEIAILFWLTQGLQGYKTFESTTSGFRCYESFRVSGRYSATYGPIGLRIW